jgi:hypothetical protein
MTTAAAATVLPERRRDTERDEQGDAGPETPRPPLPRVVHDRTALQATGLDAVASGCLRELSAREPRLAIGSGRGRAAKSGRRKAESRRHRAEGRRQKAEGRKQKAESRKQKAEGTRQKPRD